MVKLRIAITATIACPHGKPALDIASANWGTNVTRQSICPAVVSIQ